MRKITALLGLDGLNPAGIIRLEHNAGTIGSVNQRKAAAVALQMAKLVDECNLIHAEIGCYGRNILVRKADIAFPSAASSAALAGVDNLGSIAIHHISQGFRAAAVMCGGRT